MAPQTPLPRLAALLSLAVAACGLEGDGDLLAQSHHARPITDGQEASGHRSVGFLAAGDTVGCTGTVVGQRTVLTAGHCVSGDTQTFVLDGAEYASESSAVHAKYDPNTRLNDVGLLSLTRPVHVVPAALAPWPRGAGYPVTLVGFGATTEGASDHGTKRKAANTIKSLHTTTFNIAGTGGGTGNVCHRDSGAPVFEDAKGQGPQIGVVIGGVKPCGTTGIAIRVDYYLSWLRDKAGSSGIAVKGEPGTFGLPCDTGKDCKSGLCQVDQASGDRHCSATCAAGGAACPGGGVCVEAVGGKATCLLPAPPEADDTGCTVGGGVRGQGLLVGLLTLLVLGLRARARHGV